MIENIEDRLFVLDKKKFLNVCQTDHRSDGPLQVREIDDGVILPLRMRTDHFHGDFAFEGGVCDKTGAFLAGLRRYTDPKKEPSNLSCLKAYAPDREPMARHETVIFGGVLYWIFGHAVTECLSRLWWFAEHPDTPYKVVFLDIPRNKGFQYWNILEAMGLSRDRIEVVTEPTRFDRIIVPEQAWIMYGEYHREMLSVYDAFKARVEPGPYKKVYLSRTKYFRKEEVNEAYYEDFFRRRRFVVVHPEKLSFREQVSIISGAEELACLQSSLIYMTAFCQPGARVTILTRMDAFLKPYMMTLQLRELDYTIVHANYNFLPVTTWNSTAYLYGPTKQWIGYLDERGIEYEENEVSFDLHVKPYIYEYLTRWAKKAAVPGIYKTIHNRTLIDVVDGVNRELLQTTIERKDMQERDDVAKLKKQTASLSAQNETIQAENAKLKEQNSELADSNALLSWQNECERQVGDDLRRALEDIRLQNAELQKKNRKLEGRLKQTKKRLKKMEDSRSWRITKPLRAVGRACRRILGKA